MLVSLHVRNLVLVENAHLNLAPGLVAFTGETGAGKSLLLGSLLLAMGERASAEYIGSASDECTVEAEFSDLDVTFDIRRILRENGNNVVRIDGENTSLQRLRERVEPIVTLLAQGDVRLLADSAAHIQVVDTWLDSREYVGQVADAWSEYESARNELRRLEQQEGSRQAQLDLIGHRLEQIENDVAMPDEWPVLLEQLARCRYGAQIIEAVETGLERIREGEQNIEDQLADVLHRVEGLAPTVTLFAEVQEHLGAAQDQVAAAARLLQRARSRDDEELDVDALEARVHAIEQYEKKYGVSPEEQWQDVQSLGEQRAMLTDYDTRLEGARRVLERHTSLLEEVCAALTAARERAGQRLVDEVLPFLSSLALEGSNLAFSFRKGAYSAQGCDVVELLFSANPGVPMRPINKVASGGELSRVLLALQAAAAERLPQRTFVLDEIDAGVGGQTAYAVANALRAMAERHQVVVITHLPQVAAAANQHFALEKATMDGRVTTTVRELDEKQRLAELGRMIGDAEGQESLELVRQMRARFRK